MPIYANSSPNFISRSIMYYFKHILRTIVTLSPRAAGDQAWSNQWSASAAAWSTWLEWSAERLTSLGARPAAADGRQAEPAGASATAGAAEGGSRNPAKHHPASSARAARVIRTVSQFNSADAECLFRTCPKISSSRLQ